MRTRLNVINTFHFEIIQCNSFISFFFRVCFTYIVLEKQTLKANSCDIEKCRMKIQINEGYKLWENEFP